MKKRVGKVKRFIAMLMVGITLSSSVFYSYSIPAQAAAILPTAEAIMEALMTIFGYSLGLNKSISSISNSLDSSVLDSIYSGSAIDVGSYGAVDFSDGASIYDFLSFAQDFMSSHVLGSYYHNYFARMDYLSYKNSGTSASKTMLDGMQALIEDIDVELSAQPDADAEHRAALIREFMITSIVPLLSPGGDGDDDEPHSTSKAWRVLAGLMAAFTAVSSIPILEDGTEDESALATPEESEYLEYVQDDLVLGDDGFINWNVVDGVYTASFSFIKENGDSYNCVVKSLSPFFSYESGSPPLFFLFSPSGGFTLSFYKNGIYSGDTVVDARNSYGVFSSTDILVSSTVPLFKTLEDGEAWVVDSSSEDGFVNLISTETVSVFYETTPTCSIPEYVVNFMTRTPSTSDVTSLATALTELSTETAGTAEYIPAVESVVQTATDALPEASTNTEEVPEESVEQEQDPETGQFNYFNILQLILNAIKAIASQVWDFFSNPITSIKNGIQNIIEIFPQQIDLVRGWIEALPGSIYQFFENPLLALQEGLAAINSLETIWPRLQPYLDQFLALFQNSVPEPDLTDPDIPSEDEGGNGRHSFDILSLLNGLWLIILILLMLLSIFLHLMIFIINIFKIPASTGFLNDDMVLGLNYIKTLEIAGIGLSVYDFMMGLVYILMVFGVVKVLRHNIDHFKIPKARNGGIF